MNSRPKTEEPIDLVTQGSWLVSKSYRWVPGESGVRKPREARFLIASEDAGAIRVKPPDDLYLELARLNTTEESILAFAARFGTLGLRREHFHSTECSEIFGESAPAWGQAIGEFQFWFRVWEAVENRDLRALGRMLSDARVPPEVFAARDLRKTALRAIVNSINNHLHAWAPITVVHQGCFKQSCPFNTRPLPSKQLQYVSYELRVSEIGGGNKITGHLNPSSLLVAAWLQLAEVACGQRRFRPCDICGQLMDVSKTARPGSKRVHGRCSLTQRMRRYRARLGGENEERH
jgi:hypothetical protein